MAPRSVSIPGGGGGSGGGGRGPCHCDHLMGSLMDEARVVEEGREKERERETKSYSYLRIYFFLPCQRKRKGCVVIVLYKTARLLFYFIPIIVMNTI